MQQTNVKNNDSLSQIMKTTLLGIVLIFSFFVNVSFPCPCDYTIWESDVFDELTLGSLDGQNGWIHVSGGSDASVITDNRPVCIEDNILMINPDLHTYLVMSKDLPDQSGGRHVFEIMVKAEGCKTTPDVARLELKTTDEDNDGWDNKFRLIFGRYFQVQWGPDAVNEIVTLVNIAEMRRWYLVRIEMDLDQNKLDAYLDNQLMASNIPMQGSSILSMNMVGYDKYGEIFFDYITGRTDIPDVNISSPAHNATVSGTVAVNVPFTGGSTSCHSEMKFFVDGHLYDSISYAYNNTTPVFNWDTTYNHLPAPFQTQDIGYYGLVGYKLDEYDVRYNYNYISEVSNYTNTIYVGRLNYDHTGWQTAMESNLADAVAQGMKIVLCMDMQVDRYAGEPDNQHIKRILEVADAYWNDVVRIEVAHDPDPELMGRQRIKSWINNIEYEMGVWNTGTTVGLPLKPMGVTAHYQSTGFDPVEDWFTLDQVDWAGIKIDLPGPGSPSTYENMAEISYCVTAAMNKVPVEKEIALVLMAHTQAGVWDDLDRVREFQVPVYLLGHDNSRVIGYGIYHYGYDNYGTRANPDLKSPHKLIGNKLTLKSGDLNGKKTLKVQVYDDEGEGDEKTIMVNVNN